MFYYSEFGHMEHRDLFISHNIVVMAGSEIVDHFDSWNLVFGASLYMSIRFFYHRAISFLVWLSKK